MGNQPARGNFVITGTFAQQSGQAGGPLSLSAAALPSPEAGGRASDGGGGGISSASTADGGAAMIGAAVIAGTGGRDGKRWGVGGRTLSPAVRTDGPSSS